MVNKNETTNSEKKPIIDNDEALRLIDLIQQGDSNAENDLAELGSVFIKAVAKQYVGKGQTQTMAEKKIYFNKPQRLTQLIGANTTDRKSTRLNSSHAT